jgi:Tol biopolymer transport system component
MTAFDRFDLVDARVAAALEELGAATRPDYINDALQVTATRRQRPRWTFLERLLPMDTTMRRPMGLRRVPLGPLVALLLLLIAAVAAALYVGSRPTLAPFGPAANGQVLYVSNGDLYVRNRLDEMGTLIVSLPGDQFAPTWSPNGEWFAFISTTSDGDNVLVARADGTDVHPISSIPKTGNAQGVWRPDSQAIGFIYNVQGIPQLTIAPVDGSPPQQLDLGTDFPTELAWRPPNGDELLVRIIKHDLTTDYLTIRPDGTGRHDFGLPSSELMSHGWNNPAAAWSPDGSRIAYSRVAEGADHEGGPFRVHVMHADGTGDVALPGSTDATVSENWPLFSPDGRWILINRFRWGSDSTQQAAWLAVMPSDGSAPARDIGPTFKADNEIQLAKSWSPDGTRVQVYQSEDRGALSIDPQTGKVDDLTWTTDLPDIQRTIR